MTLRAIKTQVPDVMARLKARFGLTFPPAIDNLLIPGYINLVSDVDVLLRRVKRDFQGAVDLSAAAGTYVVFFTVPAKKRWHLLGYATSVTVAGSQLIIRDSANQQFPLADANTVALFANNLRIPMDERWDIGRTTTGNAGDSSESLFILYEEEDAF